MRGMPGRALPPHMLQRCRELRRRLTDAEALLWSLLRNQQLKGMKFRRQHPHGSFIVDFYCHAARLAIELDGGVHALPEQSWRDSQRTRALEAEGIHVLRFWNHEVLKNTEGVLETILQALAFPHPGPLPRGEGSDFVDDEKRLLNADVAGCSARGGSVRGAE